MNIYIPENKYGIQPGYYTINSIVQLLRENKYDIHKVQFIADMMEQ